MLVRNLYAKVPANGEREREVYEFLDSLLESAQLVFFPLALEGFGELFGGLGRLRRFEGEAHGGGGRGHGGRSRRSCMGGWWEGLRVGSGWQTKLAGEKRFGTCRIMRSQSANGRDLAGI